MDCSRLTPTSSLGLFAVTHKEALVTVLGKACYHLTHFSKNKLCEGFVCLGFFCLADNRLGRVRNAVNKEVIQPSNLTLRESAKQTSSCHCQDRSE